MDMVGLLRSLGVLFVFAQVVFAGCLGVAPPSGGAPDTVYANGTVDAGPDVTYYPENDTVRFGALTQGSEVAEYWNTTFDQYASWQCGEIAVERMGQFIERNIDNRSIIVGYGFGSGTVDVDYHRSVDRARVDRQLPDRVETTIELFKRTHTCTVPVDLDPSGRPKPLDVAQHR